MRKPCIVKQLLTMQGFSIFGPPFLEFTARWFAYGNRIYWLCGQAYANRAGTRAAFSDFQARWFAYENRIYWLCGQAYANRAGSRAAFSEFQARWFAYENRIYWLCGQAYANRAGSCQSPGRLFRFSRPGGLRTKTDFIGLAGRRAQTVPAAARPRVAFLTFPGPVVCVRKPNLLA